MRSLGYLTALVLSAVVAWHIPHPLGGVDFFNYWIVPQLNVESESSIYDDANWKPWADQLRDHYRPEDQAGFAAHFWPTLDLTASPFLYALFSPFSKFDYSAALFAFRLVGLLLGMIALLLFAQTRNLPNGPLWVAGAFAVFAPIHTDLALGNANLWQMAGLVAALIALPRRVAWAGVAFGLLIVFRPTLVFAPLVLFSYWAQSAQWIRLRNYTVGFAFGLLAGVFIGAVYFKSLSIWPQWFHVIESLMSRTSLEVRYYNFAPAQILFEWIGWDRTLLLRLFGVLGLGAVWYLPRVTHTARRDVELWLVLCSLALGLLVSGLAWNHYQVLLLPLILALSGTAHRFTALAGAFFLSLNPLWVNAQWPAAIQVCGIALLFALGVLRLRRLD